MKQIINRKLTSLFVRLAAERARFSRDDRGDNHSTSVAGWVIIVILLIVVIITFLLPFVRDDLLPMLAQRIKDLFNVT